MKSSGELNPGLKALRHEIESCRLCPRLVAFREGVPKKKCFEEPYWRKPVPGFGDPAASILILGLAPAPHGGNRTGRIFTGDQSARFLMKALHRQGLASHPYSENQGDGLQLFGCYITAAVKCVPPKNSPTAEETLTCSRFLYRELNYLCKVRVVLALGRLAFHSYLRFAEKKAPRGEYPFIHGETVRFPTMPPLIACYHPSPQNTNRGLLTEAMLNKVLEKAKKEAGWTP